ncbi:MAG: hypothetical protein LBF54_03265 [Holosporaceae bacterium]|jgi:hypothetical protein|nr:hypothetical protein [Holosporaceae bacterium]
MRKNIYKEILEILLCCCCVLADSCVGMMKVSSLEPGQKLHTIGESAVMELYVNMDVACNFDAWIQSKFSSKDQIFMECLKMGEAFSALVVEQGSRYGLISLSVDKEGVQILAGGRAARGMRLAFEKPYDYEDLEKIAQGLVKALERMNRYSAGGDSAYYCLPEKDLSVRNKAGKKVKDFGN